ncbi:6-bladed beta-propeller [bacterium]|nr:6-bladed beta-propeller [bacterium]
MPGAAWSVRRWLAPLWLSVILASGLACTRGPVQVWQPAATPVTWPLPPETPRIRYEGSITAGQALKFRSGGFSLLDALFGRPEIVMTAPHGVAADATAIVIADSVRAQVHVLDLVKRRHRVVTEAGPGAFHCPIGVALDGQDGMWVTDSALARVLHLSMSGKTIGEIEGPFVRPTGIAYDRQRQRVYVVDTGSHAVLCYQRRADRFELLRKLGARGDAPGAFNFPTHAAVGTDGTLYVTDSLNHRIQVFTPEGEWVRAFGQAGDGTGDFSKAKGVATDGGGHIYVVDSLYDVVQIFDREGRLLLVFGGSGRDGGSLWLPTGICIDHEDRIYVSDSGNSRVQVYQRLAPAQ